MNNEQPELARIQRWMQSVIMHPDGVQQGMRSSEATRHLDVGGNLEAVISPSRALTSEQRLEIYVDAYFERLLECLREEFTVTCQCLGEDLFNAVAFGYLQAYPSRSYTLGDLGARFPQFLAESQLHSHATPPLAPDSWAEFVIELATFERSQREVFDGPGVEGLPPWDLNGLLKLPQQAWNDLRLVAAPSLRLHQFKHRVSSYWIARRDGEDSADIECRPQQLAIHRRDYQLERHELSAEQHTLLRELMAGASLGTAIAAVTLAHPAASAAWSNQLGGWFQKWTRWRYFVALRGAGAA